MKYFIFRNTTVERYFQIIDASFSGYEDISNIDLNADRYIWFYLPPIKVDTNIVAEEIKNYINLLKFAHSQIPNRKMLIVFTMNDLFSLKTLSSNSEISEAINYYNNSLHEWASKNSEIKIIDFSAFATRYSLADLIDWKYYFISQMVINPKLTSSLQGWFIQQINAIEFKRKKCLILDLDNTLWGGVLGEDGINGITLGGDYPGKAYSFFQKQIEFIGKQGIVLCVCSKNNIEDVRELWAQHPESILKENHFAALKINWINKADNIRQLAEELNIGLDSMVFIDDNPAEREIVKNNLPDVVVPDFPQHPYQLPSFFKEVSEKYFSIYSLTSEDLKKTEQYKQNAARATSKLLFSNLDEYIKNLQISLDISEIKDLSIPRVSQLTQKTNQFNLTTQRYTDVEIKNLLENDAKIFTLSVSDKFGDYGLTGVLIAKKKNHLFEIDTLLLSCRILGKRIEEAFVYFVLRKLKFYGVEKVMAKFFPTNKNVQVTDFYEKVGFSLINETDGIKNYEFHYKGKEIELIDYFDYK